MTDQTIKTRPEREEELRRLLNSPRGNDRLYPIFVKALGLKWGEMAPVGLPMIQTILAKEYPNG
ncbi:MAG TPA: hypothetical protein DDY78_26395 [Planctomycetales bacterium]|jgi:hypothetical protein|nr:hypothetical protein [Planctomycetales bacterium]